MIRNVASQSIGVQMVNATSGAAFTSAVTVYVTGDAGTQAIGSVGSGICTHEGNGYHTYRPSQAETDYGLIGFTFIGTGAVPVTIQVETITAAQESALAGSTGSLAITVQQLVTDALQEIGVLNAVDPPSGELATYAVRKLNRLLDNWNGERNAVYTSVRETFTLTPSLQPHTIGPSSATFIATQRPQTIDGANLIISGVRYALRIRDAAWWMGVRMYGLTSSIPTDLFYDPAWPNGNIYLWPVGSAAQTLELQRRVVLGQVVLTDTFWLPPGYQDAITLTLAEELAAPLRVAVSPLTARSAERARARVFGNNSVIPTLTTRDFGLPSSRGGLFDYRTGRLT